MNVAQPSIAARVLNAIAMASYPIDTTEIYNQVDEAENITIVSVTCRDLLHAGKVSREMRNGRWHYWPAQPDLLAAESEPAAVEDLQHAVAASPEIPTTPTTRGVTRPLRGRRAEPVVDRTLKLRTLDKLIELLADDIAAVLRAVRTDLESMA